MTTVKSILSPGHLGVAGKDGVTIFEMTRCSLIQIAAWPETLDRTASEAADAIGADMAPEPGRATIGPRGTLLRVEPLKWWLIDHTGLPSFESGVLLDLSHARKRLHLGGQHAARLLNHVLSLNLSESAFPEDTVASTAFHHVGMTLWRDASGFNLLLPRSFAASLSKILTESALQYRLHTVQAHRTTNPEGI